MKTSIIGALAAAFIGLSGDSPNGIRSPAVSYQLNLPENHIVLTNDISWLKGATNSVDITKKSIRWVMEVRLTNGWAQLGLRYDGVVIWRTITEEMTTTTVTNCPGEKP